MRPQRKNKTVKSGTIAICQVTRRKNVSTTNSFGLDKAKFIALDFIQTLLSRVQQQDKFNQRYIRKVEILMKQFSTVDDTYFRAQQAIHHEPSCIAEQQPKQDQPMTMGTLNKALNYKIAAIKTINSSAQFKSSLKSIRKTYLQNQNKDTQIIIQKLKKDYIAILNSQYSSQTKPLAEITKYFQTKDAPQIAIFRNYLSQNPTRTINIGRKSSMIDEPTKYKSILSQFNPSSANKTIQSKNKNNKSDCSDAVSSRNIKLGPVDQNILIKETKLNQISITQKPLKSIYQNLKATQQQLDQNNIQIDSIQAASSREKLNSDIKQYLFHLRKINIKQICQKQGKTKDKNSQSANFLPKIGRQ